VSKLDQIRELAEADLYAFARLVNPNRVYGDIHKEVFKWWMESEETGKDNTALLLPRDHQKSHCAAVYAAWTVTRKPESTLLYVSATAALAEAQLRAICDILDSTIYRKYWPTMTHPDKGKREKWTNSEIIVDHPDRKKEVIRDPTIKAVGLTGTITGFHATHVFLDDMVEPNNAYTEGGRYEVKARYSQLASVETTGAREVVVGTRYHPADLYSDLMEMVEPEFDDSGEIIGERSVYDFKVEVVEDEGKFLWPKESRPDGKMFGFDHKELARKKAKYLDKTQFFAQYYQEPNDPESNRLSYDGFQYYEPSFLRRSMGGWKFKESALNIYASIDFAFTVSKKSDFTAIVVVGIDSRNNVYVLDIERFKTDKIQGLYDKVAEMHSKWQFNKLRAEVNSAQGMIARDLKDRLRQEGMRLSIDTASPNRWQGSKEERIAAVLEPRYENGNMWHYKGGFTPVLEEELVLARPAHDDVKDALASAVEVARAPMRKINRNDDNKVIYHSKFGGVAH
jgi:phage terminase large subunit-like protein